MQCIGANFDRLYSVFVSGFILVSALESCSIKKVKPFGKVYCSLELPTHYFPIVRLFHLWPYCVVLVSSEHSQSLLDTVLREYHVYERLWWWVNTASLVPLCFGRTNSALIFSSRSASYTGFFSAVVCMPYTLLHNHWSLSHSPTILLLPD